MIPTWRMKSARATIPLTMTGPSFSAPSSRHRVNHNHRMLMLPFQPSQNFMPRSRKIRKTSSRLKRSGALILSKPPAKTFSHVSKRRNALRKKQENGMSVHIKLLILSAYEYFARVSRESSKRGDVLATRLFQSHLPRNTMACVSWWSDAVPLASAFRPIESAGKQCMRAYTYL